MGRVVEKRVNLTTDDWIDMEQVLSARYEVAMRSVNPSSLRVTNRVSFVARPNATRTPMSKRTMHPAVDPGITPGDGNRQEQKRDTPKRDQTSTMANTTDEKRATWTRMTRLVVAPSPRGRVSSKMESWPVCGKKWYNEKLKTHMICDWRLDPANPTVPERSPRSEGQLGSSGGEST